MTYFTKRYHTPGTSPGTLIRHDKVERAPLKILLTDYTDSEYSEQLLTEPEECAAYLERETVKPAYSDTVDVLTAQWRELELQAEKARCRAARLAARAQRARQDALELGFLPQDTLTTIDSECYNSINGHKRSRDQ